MRHCAAESVAFHDGKATVTNASGLERFFNLYFLTDTWIVDRIVGNVDSIRIKRYNCPSEYIKMYTRQISLRRARSGDKH